MEQSTPVLKCSELLGQQFQVFGTPQEPLFKAKDVASMLRLTNVSEVIRRVDEEERAKLNLGRQGATWMLTEAGLYEVLMQSRKPIAKQFKKGVKVILKEIRQNGGYLAQTDADTPETLMARALKVADATLSNYEQRIRQQQERIEAQTQQLQLQAPKVQYADEVLSARGTYTTTQMAKELGLSSAIKLHNLLKAGGDMFKRSEQWFVTAKHAGKDLTAVRTTAYIDHQGKSATRLTTVWTEKGRAWLHSKFGQSESAASLFDQLSVKGGAK